MEMVGGVFCFVLFAFKGDCNRNILTIGLKYPTFLLHFKSKL